MTLSRLNLSRLNLSRLNLSRRSALLGLGTTVGLAGTRLALANAPTDRRLVVIILRGAMDGLAAVVPYGDPAYAALRGPVVMPGVDGSDALLDLGGFYGLHPALTNVHAMYQANQVLIVHAVAGPYRIRSHFEAQDCLESGADHRMTSGWLNRAVSAMGDTRDRALAVGVSVPLLLRGPAGVANWAPHGLQQPPAALYAAIAALNRDDPLTGPAIAEGLRDRGFSAAVIDAASMAPNGRNAFPALAQAAGDMLRAPEGPRIAALEIGGWDTHTAQANRLAQALKQLDAGLGALRTALDTEWTKTAVLVITEFGRTARLNGTGGTDHGTATVAFLAGGAVAGGSVRATWPGLNNLFENRDLAPTTDLRAVARGVLAQHLGLDNAALDSVFPDSRGAGAMAGLIG
jgi:uncharacterized protein (DUF1501 family)